MRYPTLSVANCHRLVERGFAGNRTEVDLVVRWKGTGPEVDLTDAGMAATNIQALYQGSQSLDPDVVEGKAAVLLFSALAETDEAVLEDPGFWRYLSVGIAGFYGFIRWREKKSFADGTQHKYIEGLQPTESVLPRMYLRVRALGGVAHGDLASAIPRAADFWRSHIVRVRTSAYPPIVRAFAKMQRDDRLNTNPLRKVAKDLSALRANVVLHDYDDSGAGVLLLEHWSKQ